jgi:DNA-binding response OmpR family regulator
VEGRRIVVVEDEEPLRSLMEEALRSEGYEVSSTGDPGEAVPLVRRIAPDLVLLDTTSLDGSGALWDLRGNKETAQAPLVLLTGEAGVAPPGVLDSIRKPFPLDVLVQRVFSLLQHLPPRGAPAAGALDEIVIRDPTSLAEEEGPLPDFKGVPDALKTVLVVEDNALFRRFLKEILVRCGFNVLEAASGDEGLRLALTKKPHLIVTDIIMPGLDGFELCRSVRGYASIRHTPIVFLSGWDEYDQRNQGLEAGASDFLSKRVPVRELLLRIRLILARFEENGREGPDRPGMEGRLDSVGPSGLLQMCHIGRLTGICRIRSGSQVAEIRFRDGEIVGAWRPGFLGAHVVHDLVSWTSGRFEFTRMEHVDGDPLGDSFEALILEGCRLLDEKRRPAATELLPRDPAIPE